MKKITLFAALAALFFVSCNKDESSLIKMSNHTITASMETDNPETRTAFNETGALYWIAGDDIAVLSTNGSFTKYTLTEGANTPDATFTAAARIGSNSTYALHPYSKDHKYEDSELTFNLPDTYTYTEKSDDYGTAPMMAVSEEVDASSYSFKHLGGAFCFTIKNLPAGVTYFKFEADEQITGDFAVEEAEDGYHVISLPEAQASADDSYAVTITFPAEESATDKRFFIPLPEGTIDGFKISIGKTEGETWAYTSTKSNNIERTELVAMPEVTLNATVDGTVATEVSTEEQLVAAADKGGKIVLAKDIDLSSTLWIGADCIIDLNGHYIKNANGTTIKVKSGKTLTIGGESNNSIVESTHANGAAIWNMAGTLIINSGTYKNVAAGAPAIHCDRQNDDNSRKGTWNLTINGGEFIGQNFTAVSLQNNRKSENHPEYTDGKATINGGTFTGKNYYDLFLANVIADITESNCKFTNNKVFLRTQGGAIDGGDDTWSSKINGTEMNEANSGVANGFITIPEANTGN